MIMLHLFSEGLKCFQTEENEYLYLAHRYVSGCDLSDALQAGSFYMVMKSIGRDARTNQKRLIYV